jgi:hypothetical protein
MSFSDLLAGLQVIVSVVNKGGKVVAQVQGSQPELYNILHSFSLYSVLLTL